jgi:hypothetical protein
MVAPSNALKFPVLPQSVELSRGRGANGELPTTFASGRPRYGAASASVGPSPEGPLPDVGAGRGRERGPGWRFFVRGIIVLRAPTTNVWEFY